MSLNNKEEKMHPSFAEIKKYFKTEKSSSFRSDIESSEEAQSISEGMEIFSTIAKKSNKDFNALVAESKARVLKDISSEKESKRDYQLLKYAASIVLLIAIGFAVLKLNSEPSLLEEESTFIYKAPPLLRSSEQNNWKAFHALYEEGEFRSAFETLNSFQIIVSTLLLLGLYNQVPFFYI